VKHTSAGMKSYATLVNATASGAGVFTLIGTVFGFGILEGGVISLPPNLPFLDRVTGVAPRWDRLFNSAERGAMMRHVGEGIKAYLQN